MSPLFGLRYTEVARKLRAAGFQFDRMARGSHEIWRNDQTQRYTILPHHSGAIPEGTLRAIIRQAGLSAEDFMEL